MKKIDVFTLMNALEECGFPPVPRAYEKPAPSSYAELTDFLNVWFNSPSIKDQGS